VEKVDRWQVDRLLSNQKIDVRDSFARWIPHLIGARREIVVAMDWTGFDRDDQATLALDLVTGHGRATPLLWLTVWKEELTERRNDFEDTCLMRLKALVPPGCAVTILADRGFGDHKLFKFLDGLDLVTSSGFVAISMSPMPRAGRVRPPNGSANRAERESCAMPGSPRRTLARSRRGLRPGEGDEGALVSCRKQRRGAGRDTGKPLRQALDDRTQLPR
jgi:hypothetical protein